MIRGNFIADNELNSARGFTIEVVLTPETWMNFANNAAVLTMSNTFAIFYLLTVMHITDKSHYKIIGFSGFSHVMSYHSHVRAVEYCAR